MEYIRFLSGRGHNSLITGAFFLRVSAWWVHILTKALALHLTNPEIDLGNRMDQVAMSLVMPEDYGLNEADAAVMRNTPQNEIRTETPREDNPAVSISAAGMVQP